VNNFAEYITPEKAFKLNRGNNGRNLDWYKRHQKDHSMCQCGQEKVWRYAGTGLCFSCTTGEADASDDYELEE